MSDITPTTNDPRATGAGTVPGGDPERPPLPAQPAAAAAAAGGTGPSAYAAASDAARAPGERSPYAAQAPYTAPAPAGYAAAAYPASHDPHAATSAFGQAAADAGTRTADPATGKVGAGKIVGIMVAAALIGGASGLGFSAAGASLFPQSQTVVTAGPSTVTVNNTDSVTATTAIAAKVVPSVVTISATSGSSGGTGSGVVLSEDGYIATNTHVVTLDGETANATLSVTTSDGKVYPAEIVGTDPVYDLAVIKLTGASGLTPIEFGDSSKLNVGDQTVAVGAPLGLSNTVTTGIVSALNRSIQIASSAAPEGQDEDQEQGPGQSPFQFDYGQGQQQSSGSGSISISVIQTDASINPGNSGGALVDGDGELIGINVAIATASGSSDSGSGSIGVGFSIPSDIVQRITDELISDGEATHGLLGAMVGDAAAQEGATTAGAYISEVSSGGAAAAGGLREGDVVTTFNGVPITDATDLTAQVRALAAGSDATVVYQRDGQTASTDVTLGTLTQ